MIKLSQRIKLMICEIDDLIVPKHAVKIKANFDIAIYDTFCVYCANNNIKVEYTSNKEFNKCAEMIANFDSSSDNFSNNGLPKNDYYFWIE